MNEITRTNLDADLGAALRILRAARGLSQAEVAKASGLGPAYVSMLERSKRENPSRETVKKLASALGVDPLVFLCLGITKETREKMEDWEVSLCARTVYKALAK